MSKTWIWIVVALIVIVGAVYIIRSTPNTTEYGAENSNSSTPGVNEENKVASPQGRVVFSVTDAAANMSTISEVNMKVNRVDVHSDASGWVIVSSTPKTYNLLDLKAKSESQVLADIQAKATNYDGVRLIIDSVSVKTKAGVTKTAKLPSQEFTIDTTLVVEKDKTSSVNLDFLVDKSLHTTTNSEYVFAPVVKTESKSGATVGVDTTSKVTISGGKVDSTNTMGMDIDGSVKLNFQLNTAQKLNIDASNVIKLEGALLQ